MRIIRVKYGGASFYAALTDDNTLHCLQKNLNIEDLSMSDVTMLPLVAPSKIVCVGLNYRAHADELNMPFTAKPPFFLKPPSSLIGNKQTILLPPGVGRVDYEAELALIIGQPCRHVSPQEAKARIFGYTCANDVTARDLQKDERLMGRCKSYDTFCPVGAWIETELPPPDSEIRAVVNGEVRQQGYLADMLLPPLDLVSYLSDIMTLLPGDLVLTGTTRGIGPILDGDKVSIEVDNVGILQNDVLAELSISPLLDHPESSLQ